MRTSMMGDDDVDGSHLFLYEGGTKRDGDGRVQVVSVGGWRGWGRCSSGRIFINYKYFFIRKN